MMSTATAKNDIDRFGMFPFRASPRQADVLIVAGTLTTKMAGPLVRLWEQMPEPKWCVAMGTCTTSGGRFKRSYSVVQGVDRVMPVDVYVPGCPPRPEGLIYGLIKLQELVKQRRGAVADLRRPRPAAARLGRRRALTAPAAAGALVRALTDRFPDLAASLWTDEDTVEVQAEGARNVELLTAVRDDPELNFWWLGDAAAVDYGPTEHFEVVYHLYSDLHPAWLRIRCRVNRADPHIPTITGLWEGAMFHEREMYDMMGIVFDGNRDLRRIYMSPDYRSFPQRKDFLLPDDAADSSAAGVVPLERPETWDLSRFREQATSSSAPHPHSPAAAERTAHERTVMTATEPETRIPDPLDLDRQEEARLAAALGTGAPAPAPSRPHRAGRVRRLRDGRHPGPPAADRARGARCTRWTRARCCSTWGRSTPPPTASCGWW